MAGRLRYRNAVYTPSGSNVTKFTNDDVIKQYDSYVSKLIADCNAWRLVALACVILIALALAFLAYTIHLPQTKLVVIGVNDIGQTKYYGETSGISYDGYELKDNIIQNMLTDFIKKTYLVTTDSELMYNNFTEAMSLLDQAKRRNYEMMIKDTDPFSQVGKIKRTASIESIIPVSSSSYQVDWTNTESDIDGYYSTQRHYKGIFTLQKVTAKQYNEMKKEERIKNPMGIFITDYTIVDKEEEMENHK